MHAVRVGIIKLNTFGNADLVSYPCWTLSTTACTSAGACTDCVLAQSQEASTCWSCCAQQGLMKEALHAWLLHNKSPSHLMRTFRSPHVSLCSHTLL